MPYQPSPRGDWGLGEGGLGEKNASTTVSACCATPVQGRIGVYEVLRRTDAMKSLIVERDAVPDRGEMAADQGMVTLQDQAMKLVERDVSTVAEIMRTIYVV